MPKSSLANQKFARATWRGSRSAHTLLLQMAQDVEKLAAQAQRLKDLRAAKGRSLGRRVTQEIAADAIGVTLRAYQAWEAGGGIDPDNLKKAADFFETTPDFIEYGERQQAPMERNGRSPDLLAALTGVPERLAAIEERVAHVPELLELVSGLDEQVRLLRADLAIRDAEELRRTEDIERPTRRSRRQQQR
jgi:transcriptional regulator with XRE-family HTH domain